ncbi:hypothetical protein [Actinomadura sp. WMMB 499]|uniref:hypothetical protein n=1 Tax=Actinomadura sp. WMMB 499 TaxID=1219491 RepID=UPI0012445502|nr:hypothetical protein [Actinomadura sp. WMMB 499]QFG21862.1 hypothetical protein F7P10_12705 [Actinomadura sp. WMMB 499]
MDTLTMLMLGAVSQANALLLDARQVIGLVAAVLAAMLAARLGWQGTDRILARRSEDDPT